MRTRDLAVSSGTTRTPEHAQGCRLVAYGRSTDPADWFDLDDELEREICAAVRSGAAIVDVLRAHDVSRGRYYLWLRIGRGEATDWGDGCTIDDHVRERCWRLAIAVAEARLAHNRAQLAALQTVRQSHRNSVRLVTSESTDDPTDVTHPMERHGVRA